MMDTKPSTHYHAPLIKLINGVTRGLNAFGVAKIDLSETTLLGAARKATGLKDFGDESFLPGLRVLLESLNTEANLNPYGRLYARENILNSLKNRLWANANFVAHPEILQRKIVAPIIVIGPHRSGTTRLHRMLASDDRLQHLKTWEGFNPAPRQGLRDLGRAARYHEVRKVIRMGDRLYPGAYAGHPMDADWAEEEMLLLNHSFCSFSILGSYNVPSYYKWFLNHDKTAAYAYMADMMRLISWSRGDSEEKRWVLKNPQHMLDLDVLMKTFPDAKLVFTHRDPLKTVASVMSLMWHYAVQHTDLPVRGAMRDVWLDFCEKAARRSMQAREAISGSQQLDVYYEEINRDWRSALKRVYDFSGLDFTSDAEQVLGNWLSKSESENRHSGHRYSLEDFGVSPQEVDGRMMFARERYVIPYEKR